MGILVPVMVLERAEVQVSRAQQDGGLQDEAASAC